MRAPSKFLASVILVALAACGSDTPIGPDPTECDPQTGEVALTLVDLGIDLQKPIVINSRVGDDRLFIMENQRGKIYIYRNGMLEPEPFIDLEGQIANKFEQGLLGMVFHPDHANNRKVYVSFTVPITGDVAVVEFLTVAGNPDTVNTGTGKPIITIPQPWSKHNAGTINFGPDGYMYIAIGNSLSGAIAHLETAQNMTMLLGKILRIDVDSGSVGQPYTIPPDNPYVDMLYIRPEIWHHGLRNPWGTYLDPETGRMYIPDIGGTSREELNIVESGVAGLNFGFPIMEGSLCSEAGCDQTGIELPTLDYGRGEGCAIMGGTVYRGCNFPEYHEEFFFTDWCHNFVRSIRWENGAIAETRNWTELIPPGAPGEGARVSSVASGPNGELFLADHFDNKVYAVVAAGP